MKHILKLLTPLQLASALPNATPGFNPAPANRSIGIIPR